MSNPSGHDFHFDIEDRVKAKSWAVHSKPNYLDDVELKPREIDFIASQQRESYNPHGNQVALVVECKYLNHDVEFWLRENPKNHGAYFVDGYPKEKLFVDDTKYHFFSPPKVAVTLQEKTQDKKDKMYEAIMQASKALLYFRQDPDKILYTKGLFYPVVVYKGPGKLLDRDGNQLQDALYYHEYLWQDSKTQVATTRALYVDIIHESSLERYLDDIFKEEMDELMRCIFFENKMRENKSRENKRNQAR
jgi:hypothetical protein